ncbi:hypothetical protein GCM10010442_67030 [Kitasatospora kifunensis]
MDDSLTPAELEAWHAVLTVADMLRFTVAAGVKPGTGLSWADHVVLMQVGARMPCGRDRTDGGPTSCPVGLSPAIGIRLIKTPGPCQHLNATVIALGSLERNRLHDAARSR